MRLIGTKLVFPKKKYLLNLLNHTVRRRSDMVLFAMWIVLKYLDDFKSSEIETIAGDDSRTAFDDK